MKQRPVFITALLFTLPFLSSCNFEGWRPYARWESEDGNLVLYALDDERAGYGKMKGEGGAFLDFTWQPEGGHRYSFRMQAFFVNTIRRYEIEVHPFCAFEFEKDSLHADSFKIWFAGTGPYPEPWEGLEAFDVALWEGWSSTMRFAELNDSEIDAKWFYGPYLSCADFYLVRNHRNEGFFHHDWSGFFEDMEILLVFPEKGRFLFTADQTSNSCEKLSLGTYQTGKGYVDFYFEDDSIFGFKSNRLRLVPMSNAEFISAQAQKSNSK